MIIRTADLPAHAVGLSHLVGRQTLTKSVPIARVIQEPIIENAFQAFVKLVTPGPEHQLSNRDLFYFRMVYFSAFADTWQMKRALENTISAKDMDDFDNSVVDELATFSEYQREAAKRMGLQTVNTRDLYR